ncbi:MAG: response regulator [Acidobacteriota bacterium]|nr:response regulator [Acidobacteriota bacterium]
MGLFSKVFGASPTPKPAPVDAHVAGRRILIVDPSITIQKVIELSLPGASIVAAKDAKEADVALRTGRFDLLITAVLLSDRTGYDLCSTIKSSGTTPVILMHGKFEAFDQDRAKQCGADAILSKPFEPSALATEINRLLF